MNIDHQLLHVSEKLVKMLDETADNCLPKEIANVVKTHSKLADGYLGYKYKHGVRYQFRYGDYVKMGVVGAQDARFQKKRYLHQSYGGDSSWRYRMN